MDFITPDYKRLIGCQNWFVIMYLNSGGSFEWSLTGNPWLVYCDCTLHSLLWHFVLRASWVGKNTTSGLCTVDSVYSLLWCFVLHVRVSWVGENTTSGLCTVDSVSPVSCGVLWQEPVGQESITDSGLCISVDLASTNRLLWHFVERALLFRRVHH